MWEYWCKAIGSKAFDNNQKADRDKDGIISDYEATVAKAIAKSMREQNKKKA